MNKFFFLYIRSTQDSRLHIVKDDPLEEDTSQQISAFDQLNLFDNSNDILKRIVNILFCDIFFSLLNIYSREDEILVVQLLNDFLK